MPQRKTEIAIIGAGTAGLSARSQVAKSTQNYVVIDDGVLGTTCARVGCMPSKALIQVANDYQRRAVFSSVGIRHASHLEINHADVMQHVRKLRDRFLKSVLSDIDEWKDEHLITKHARFIDKNTLDLGDESLYAEKIIIATGSQPAIPKEWLPYKRYLLDTDQFFELKDLPQKIAVIGLGAIGIELGQALHRLAVDITAIGKGESIAGISDPQLISYTSSKFAKEMKMDFGGVDSLSEQDGKLIINTVDQQYSVDKALVAIGRKPAIDHLGLENLNLEMDENGVPKFNINTLQVINSNIYITGDANSVRPVLHEASDEGYVAGYNSVSKKSTPYQRKPFMAITFSSPNIAIIGQPYQQLKDRSIDFSIGEVSFEGQGRAIVMLEETGLLRIYACNTTGEILGAELFCPAGEHMAHLLAWIISCKMTVKECLALPFYHPVLEEGLRTALRDLAKKLPKRTNEIDLMSCEDHPTNAC